MEVHPTRQSSAADTGNPERRLQQLATESFILAVVRQVSPKPTVAQKEMTKVTNSLLLLLVRHLFLVAWHLFLVASCY